jgi:3-hydroxy-9,10-secoandrosta-1,3,5(10)-triene-9,17-dione monooxygenase
MAQVAALAANSTRPAIAQPEPGLTPQELIARAQALRETLRVQQDESDARGTYSPAMHETFLASGFYRITQPRLFGGYEFDLATYYRVMLEIARGHPGVGWCLALSSSHAFEVASHWPERAQHELFGNDGLFIAPHRAPPMGTLTPVDGGYLVDGTWDYCSGIPYATHCIVGALIRREEAAGEVAHAVVPRAACTVLDDWGGDKVLGMRASGSNSVRIANAFVPAHHVATLAPGLAATPESMADGTPGTRLHGNPMYLGRLAGPFHATLVVPIIGAARAALDEYEAVIATRQTQSMPQMPRFQHFDFQRPFGHALTLTDAAEALMLKGCEMYADYCERWAARADEPGSGRVSGARTVKSRRAGRSLRSPAQPGTPITTEENMRLWGMIQHAGGMACEAVELLFHSAGSAPARKGHRLQRYFNDVAMYRGHSSAQQLNFASGLARLHFGLPWGMYGL